MITATPAPHRPPSAGFRSRLMTMVKAASPRYASVLPPPVGKKSRSTVSRPANGSPGRAMPGMLRRMNASWNARQRGVSPSRRRRESARATARLATRKASSASGSVHRASTPASIRPAALLARKRSLPAVAFRSGSFPAVQGTVASWEAIHSRYPVTSGRSAARTASGDSSAPSASIASSTPGIASVRVFSTDASGIQVVRTVVQTGMPSGPGVSRSQSHATPWPVANSPVRA